MLAALIPIEYRHPKPLIDVRLFKDRLFRSCTAVISLASVAFLGVLFTCALFFQDGLGLSALQSGLSAFPEAIGVMLGAQVATRLLYPVIGPRRLMFGGMVMLAASVARMSLVGEGTGLWWMRTLLFFAGFGMGHVFTSTQAAGFATISVADTARASTVFNTLRQLCGAIGVAAFSTVVAEVGSRPPRRGPRRSQPGRLPRGVPAGIGRGRGRSSRVVDSQRRRRSANPVERGGLARPDPRQHAPVPATGASVTPPADDWRQPNGQPGPWARTPADYRPCDERYQRARGVQVVPGSEPGLGQDV